MFFPLFFIFIIVPIIEITLLIEVGSRIGTANTIVVLLLTALIGIYMVKLVGLGVMRRMQQNMNEGVSPAEEMVNGMMLLLAGVLFIIPGFFTDAVGLLMVIPFSRNMIKKIARRMIEKKVSSGVIYINRL
ncbi:MAG: FxsA family protein [Thermodesulfovibrionia bacterium]|nr:FxsA family protein [Thermodesulfovibrionia bacterium]